MLEVQTRELPVSVPSSASYPVPVKVIVSPSGYVLPSAGLVIVAVGAVFLEVKSAPITLEPLTVTFLEVGSKV